MHAWRAATVIALAPLCAGLERAITTMRLCDRDVFLAHRLDGLAYDAIAHRFGMRLDEVEAHIASAIFHIDRVLTALERTAS